MSVSKLHKENLEKAERAKKYRDRAQERRAIVGEEDVPPRAPKHEVKVHSSASINKPVEDSNIGSKLLRKMGWKKGSGLGKLEDGIKAPIQAIGQLDGEKAGLGASKLVPVDTSAASSKARIRHKMVSRYDAIKK